MVHIGTQSREIATSVLRTISVTQTLQLAQNVPTIVPPFKDRTSVLVKQDCIGMPLDVGPAKKTPTVSSTLLSVFNVLKTRILPPDLKGATVPLGSSGPVEAV